MPNPIQLARRLLRPLRQPYWSRPWFWLSGAFLFVVSFWCFVFELWLVYAAVWLMVDGVRWAGASVVVGPAEAIRSRREDRLHAANHYAVSAR